MELSADKVSDCNEELIAVYMEFDTANFKNDKDSSLTFCHWNMWCMWFLSHNLNLSNCFACKNSTQTSSKIKDKISAAFCCWFEIWCQKLWKGRKFMFLWKEIEMINLKKKISVSLKRTRYEKLKETESLKI